MKYKYEFSAEVIEIEVSEEWANILIDLDRQEYNIKHKETRRHCSLEAYNLDDALLSSSVDVSCEVEAAENRERLYAAIAKLEPRQQKLVCQVYFEGRGYTEIAREEGCDESAIRHAVTRALKKLKKFCDAPSESCLPLAYL